MEKARVKCIQDGDSSLLVWTPASETVKVGGPPSCFAIPLISRKGGMLFMIPDEYLDPDAVLNAMVVEEDDILGPSKDFVSELCEEDDDGRIIPLGRSCRVLVIDLSDESLSAMAEYDPVTHEFESCASFDAERPASVPAVTDVLPDVKKWIEGVTETRLHFYSAREERDPPAKAAAKKGPPKKITNHTIMEHLAALSSQLQALQTQQEEMKKDRATASSAIPAAAPFTPMPATSKMPSLSAGIPAPQTPLAGVSRLLGPPPKVKPPAVLGVAPEAENAEQEGQEADQGQDPIVRAISQQSIAITSLVAHLAGGDALTELSSTGVGGSLSSKGVARREKMQQDLASRQSTYFLQIQQQLFRRLHPSLPVPRSEQELVGYGATMTSYMEKQGGYRQCKDHALGMWIAAHAMDSAMMGDMHGCKEFLALLITCMEQASYDGNWNVAFLLSLLEMPPATVFSERVHNVPGLQRPFSPLVPQQWAACALAYMKEVDVLATKKSELKISKPPPAKAPAADTETTDSPRPKRRPKFPKKPKGSPDPKAS